MYLKLERTQTDSVPAASYGFVFKSLLGKALTRTG